MKRRYLSLLVTSCLLLFLISASAVGGETAFKGITSSSSNFIIIPGNTIFTTIGCNDILTASGTPCAEVVFVFIGQDGTTQYSSTATINNWSGAMSSFSPTAQNIIHSQTFVTFSSSSILPRIIIETGTYNNTTGAIGAELKDCGCWEPSYDNCLKGCRGLFLGPRFACEKACDREWCD